MLWHFVAEFTPRGDVGKVLDDEIADAIGWKKDPSLLIAALISTKWVDCSENEDRLVIHDWHEHCDDYTRKKIKALKQDFASVWKIPENSRIFPPTIPNHTLPNLTIPEGEKNVAPDFDEQWMAWMSMYEECGKVLSAEQRDDGWRQWLVLDFEQRLRVLTTFRGKLGIGFWSASNFVPIPSMYLTKRQFNVPAVVKNLKRAATNGNTAAELAAL